MKSDVAMLFAAKEHKIVVVGPRRVGKSALVVRFLTKRFICEYVENTDMPCQRETEVDGEQLKVHIQDTSDKGMTLASIEHYLRWADAIMMIYSVTDADGFSQLKTTATTIIEKISDLKEKEQKSMPPLVLVGNKGDLELVRKVSRLDGLELAEKLRCEFFEASAREGWSKLLCSNVSSPPIPFYLSSDTDNSTPASPPVPLLTPKISPRNSPLRMPSSPKRETHKSLNLGRIGEDHVISPENFTPRWSSVNNSRQGKRCGRSYSMTGPSPDLTFSTIPQINVPNTIPRLNSYPSSPICVQEESDNSKNSKLSPAKTSKINGGFIGKLSPRLGRRFSKSKPAEESQRQSKNNRDNNNNKQSKRPKQDKMSVSLTSIPRETESNEYKQFNFNANISENGFAGSRVGSASSCGSTESLVINGQDLEARLTDSPLLSPPVSPKLNHVNQIQEQDFSSSEPFLFLCRVRPLQRARSRSRSPSNRLMNGLKKIRSLAGDNSQGPNATKQSNGGSLLVVPSYKV